MHSIWVLWTSGLSRMQGELLSEVRRDFPRVGGFRNFLRQSLCGVGDECPVHKVFSCLRVMGLWNWNLPCECQVVVAAMAWGRCKPVP